MLGSVNHYTPQRSRDCSGPIPVPTSFCRQPYVEKGYTHAPRQSPTESTPLDSLGRRHHDVSRQTIYPADAHVLRPVRLTLRLNRRRREWPLRRLGAGSVTPNWKGALRQGAGGARTRLSLRPPALSAETNAAKG